MDPENDYAEDELVEESQEQPTPEGASILDMLASQEGDSAQNTEQPPVVPPPVAQPPVVAPPVAAPPIAAPPVVPPPSVIPPVAAPPVVAPPVQAPPVQAPPVVPPPIQNQDSFFQNAANNPNQVVGPDSAGLDQRKTLDQVSNRIPNSPSGDTLPKPPVQTPGGGVKPADATKPLDKLIDAGVNKLASNPDSVAGKVADVGRDVAKITKAAAELVATEGLNLAALATLVSTSKDFLRKHGRTMMIISMVIILMIGAVTLSVGQAFLQFGDPTGSVGYGNNSLYSIDSGVYCREMSPTTPAKSAGKELFLNAVKGHFGIEEKAIAPGKLERNGANLALSGTRRADTGTTGFTDEELKYYVNMRWGYVSTYWSGKSTSPKGDEGFNIGDIAGKRIMVHTKQGTAVGIVAEFGPAPWAGAGYDHDTRYTGTNAVEPDQKALWGTAARITSPSGYKGRVLGAPPTFADLLGGQAAIQDEDVVIGFVPDDTPLGPATCTEYQPNSSVKGINGQPLAVPGTKEGTAGDCGKASMISTVRYYNPGYRDDKYYNAATNETKDPNCLSPEYLNNHNEKGIDDFVQANSTSREAPHLPVASLEMVRSSVLGGDPVIVYSSKGAIFGNSKHIFVVTGWDASTNRFYTMNPNIGSYEENTTTPNGKAMTIEHLQKYIGDKPGGDYKHAFIIRRKYLTPQP